MASSAAEEEEEATRAYMAWMPTIYAHANIQLLPMRPKIVSCVEALNPAPATILDLASGPGEPALSLARRFPGAAVISSDFEEGMLVKAREASSDVPNVEVRQLDMLDMASVASASQDVVTCSLGVNLLRTPEKAFSEIARVLRPGGIFVGTVWETMPKIPIMMEVMKDITGTDVPLPSDIMQFAGGAADPLLKDLGLVAAPGHNELVPLTIHMGPEGGEDTWKLGMSLHMAKLGALQAKGELGDVFARAKEGFERRTKDWVSEGEVRMEQIYRLIVVRKPDVLET